MNIYEVPLKPQPQSLFAKFPNGITYKLRLIYEFTPDDCWLLDISDVNDNPIVAGIPLVSGADLLAQYDYLGFGCALYCATDGDRLAVPKFYNLGVSSHLYLAA